MITKKLNKILLIIYIFSSLQGKSQDLSLFFNGQNTTIESQSILGNGEQNRTLCFWIKNYKINNQQGNVYTLYPTLDKRDSDNGRITGNNTFSLYKKTAEIMSYSSDFYHNEWHHITISNNYTGHKRSLYIDGIKVYENSQVDKYNLKRNQVVLGAWKYYEDFFNYFKGYIKDLRVYNSVLTDSLIEKNFIQTIPETNNLILHWPLNEGIGDIAYDSQGSNNGTINNGTWSKDYPPYNGYLKLKEGIGKDTIGEIGARAIIDITKDEFGLSNGLMMYQYGNKDSNLVSDENFPTQFNSRSNIFWTFSEHGEIEANISFDYSQIRGLDNSNLVKILGRDSIADKNWKVVEETSRDNNNKTITIKNVTEFSEYTLGYCSDTNYVFLESIPDNSNNIDSANINLNWQSSPSIKNFNLYIDQNYPPTYLFSEKNTNNSFLIDTLSSGTKYYWRVVGFNESGEQVESSIWSFTTSKKTNYQETLSPSIANLQIHYNDLNSNNLIEKFTIVDNAINKKSYGNTGFKCDKNTQQLVVNRFNWQYSDYVVFKDRNNQLIKEINVQPYVTYIQGLALNPKDSSFWVAGKRPNWTESSGLSDMLIVQFNKNGEYIKEIPMPGYTFGMMDYIENENALWVKENEKSLARLISLNTLDTIQTIDLKIKGEGIAVSTFDNTFWLHDGDSVTQVSKHGFIMNQYPSPVSISPNAEDIAVDPTDYTIWVSADEYLHGAINGGNRVWHLDPLHTYNKDVFFPNMIHWHEGILDDNLLLERDTLYLKMGQKKGYWTSPIINFEDYKPEFPNATNLNEPYTFLSFKFRGSDTPPSTQVNTQHALGYYSSANSENEGWGGTIPSDWIDTIPDYKYIQVKMEISLYNFPPTAIADTFNVIEEQKLVIKTTDLLINDFDHDNYPIKDFLVLGSFSQPSNGTISSNSLGNLTYLPNENFYGQDSFSYTNFDSRDTSNVQNVFINVINTNDTPIIIGQNSISMNEDEVLNFDLNGLLVDDSDNLFPQDFTFTLFSGEHYQIENNQLIPEQNYTGLINVNIQINDGSEKNNLSNIFTLKINILAVNDPPQVLNQKSISINEDTNYLLKLEDLIVQDIDNNYPLGFSVDLLSGENYSLDGNIITPNLNYYGEIQVPIILSDGEEFFSKSDTFLFSINVLPINDEPIILGQNEISVEEDQSFTLSFTDLIIEDVDNDTFTLEIGNSSDYFVSENNIISPKKDFTGVLYIPIQVNDGNDLSSIFNLQVDIIPVNDAPVFDFPSEINFFEDENSTSYDLSLFASDVDNEISSLSLSMLENPNISLVVEGNNFYFKTKNKDWFGDEEIILTLSDGEYNVLDTVKTHCLAVNDSPILYSNFSINKVIDEKYTLDITDLSFSDVDASVSENFTINLYSGNNYSISGNTIIPDANFSSTIEVPLSISDSFGAESNVSKIYISYMAANLAPKINILSEISVPEDSIVSIDMNDKISDENVPLLDLNLSWKNNPYVTISEKDKIITLSPIKDWNGTTELIFYVSNGTLTTADTLLFNCLAINDSPSFTGNNTYSFLEDEDLKINLKTIYSDVDNNFNEINFALQENTNLKYTINDSILIISNKKKNWNGIDTLKIKISDFEYTITNEVVIRCNPVNDKPELEIPSELSFLEDETLEIDFSNYISDIDNPESQLNLNWSNNLNLNITRLSDFKVKVSTNLPNWNGSELIFFELNDGSLSSFDTLRINCIPQNDAPRILLADTITFNEDENKTFALAEVVNDIDDGINTLSISIKNNTMINFTQSIDGFVLFSSVENWYGNESIILQVSDGVNQVEKNIFIQVNPINDAPVFKDIENITFNEDEQIEINLDDFVFDIDNSVSELSFEIDSIKYPLHVDLNNHLLTLSSELLNWNGNTKIQLNVTDNELSSSIEVPVICLPVNDPPVISIPDTISFFEDYQYDIDFSNYISDVDNLKSSFSIEWTEEKNIKIQNENLDLNISNKPTDWSGEENITFTVSDNHGGIKNKTSKVIVYPINDPPIAQSFYPSDEIIQIYKDSIVNFEGIVTDVDSKLDYKWYLNSKRINNSIHSYSFLFDSIGIYSVKMVTNDIENEIVRNWTIKVVEKPTFKDEILKPDKTTLFQSIPNPFNSETKISFYLPEALPVNLSIYNLSGKKIKTLISSNLKDGLHTYYWNGRDNFSVKMKSGVYIYKLQTAKNIFIQKVVLIN